MKVLLVTLHHNIKIAGRRREAACHSHAMLLGRALSAAGRDSSSRVAWWLIIAVTDLKHCISSPLPKFCTTRKCMQTFPGISSQQLPVPEHPWEEALTHVFAGYTHGSPLFHLACLHNHTHHYWVTGIENKLREYFHLARKYCYMPGRQQRKGILK